MTPPKRINFQVLSSTLGFFTVAAKFKFLARLVAHRKIVEKCQKHNALSKTPFFVYESRKTYDVIFSDSRCIFPIKSLRFSYFVKLRNLIPPAKSPGIEAVIINYVILSHMSMRKLKKNKKI